MKSCRRTIPMCLFVSMIFLGICGKAYAEVNDSIKSSHFDRHLSLLQHVEEISQGNNDLAFALYSGLKEKEGNVLFSPYGVSLALANLYLGADGETRSEIVKTMQFRNHRHDWESAFSLVFHSFHRERSLYRVNLLNTLWIDDEKPLLPSFFAESFKNGRGEIYGIDFKEDLKKNLNQINQTLLDLSEGKYRDFIHQGELRRDMEMLLCNALDVEAEWVNSFQVIEQQPMKFYLQSLNKEVETLAMEQMARLPMYKNEIFSFLELPFTSRNIGGERLVMFIILPHKGKNLSEIESIWSDEELKLWMSRLFVSKVHLKMPMFTLKMRYSLQGEMKRLGMKNPWKEEANFSKISPEKGLHLSDFFHLSSCSFNERGCNFAKEKEKEYTGGRIISSEVSVPFFVDRPFVFIIFDKYTDMILLMGKLEDPLARL